MLPVLLTIPVFKTGVVLWSIVPTAGVLVKFAPTPMIETEATAPLAPTLRLPAAPTVVAPVAVEVIVPLVFVTLAAFWFCTACVMVPKPPAGIVKSVLMPVTEVAAAAPVAVLLTLAPKATLPPMLIVLVLFVIFALLVVVWFTLTCAHAPGTEPRSAAAATPAYRHFR
jgi:hypothetical protein